ncbi:MAG: hypothetical protein QF440_01425 [Candidatus Thalassarchaeaceae archaeon]|jgi:hypothetical protein|nr:hypothetical protein [Candidatus Thalassarchaeaceae archaeon]
MRRVGVVGDGLSGLAAALSVVQGGAEAVVFGIQEPIGGRASPLPSTGKNWLFDQTPLMWRRKGDLDQALRRLKTPMPTRTINTSLLAVIRNNQRISIPQSRGMLRRYTGPLAESWGEIIRHSRRGSIPELSGLESDIVHFLGLLSHLDPTRLNSASLSQSIQNLVWKDSPRVPLDGWVGASGRLIAAGRLTDVTVLTEGQVTELRINKNGQVDGVRRKGRVFPVDSVVLACPLSSKRRILESSGIAIGNLPKVKLNTVWARYIGLSGCFMRPHIALWDADREVLAIDLAQHAPERVPREFVGSASLLHCFAYGSKSTAEKRIEEFLNTQCCGWESAIKSDITIPELRLSDAASTSFTPFDIFSDVGIFLAGSGLKVESEPGDHAVYTGMQAGRAASQF